MTISHSAQASLGTDLVNWLAAGPDSEIALPKEKDNELTQLCIAHRIPGRVLRQLIVRGQAEHYQDLYERLCVAQCEYIERQTRIEDASHRFLKDIGHIASEFVIVKGLSIFFATGDALRIHNSGDRDILIEDPSAALGLLARTDLSEFKQPVQHEEVNVLFEEYKFDFHHHFPVWRRDSDDLGELVLQEKDHFRHIENLQILEIEFSDIRDHAHERYRSPGCSIFYPRPAAAAFIQIVHFYRDLIRGSVISLRRRPRIRLQELFDIADLIDNFDFDRSYFLYLVEKYGALQQVQWCGSFLKTILQRDGLLRLIEQASLLDDPHAPTNLLVDAWNGFATAIQHSSYDLLFLPLGCPYISRHLPHNERAQIADQSYRFSFDQPGDVLHLHGDVRHFEVTVRVGTEIEITASMNFGVNSSAPLCGFVGIGLQYFHFNFDTEDPRYHYSASRGSRVIAAEAIHDGPHSYIHLKLSFDPAEQEDDGIHVIAAFGALHQNGRLDHGALVAALLPAEPEPTMEAQAA